MLNGPTIVEYVRFVEIQERRARVKAELVHPPTEHLPATETVAIDEHAEVAPTSDGHDVIREAMALRKRIAERQLGTERGPGLSLDELAEIEISSEDPDWPIDGALLQDTSRGWRAASPGEQHLRVRFDEPQSISSIQLVFDEVDRERVQEFALEWSADRGHTFRSIVRQQFSFSPGGATRQVERYSVDLQGVTDIDLRIIPDISGGSAFATLTALRLW